MVQRAMSGGAGGAGEGGVGGGFAGVEAGPGVVTLHAQWSRGRLAIWGEDGLLLAGQAGGGGTGAGGGVAGGSAGVGVHGFAASSAGVRAALGRALPGAVGVGEDGVVTLLLPTREERPVPSGAVLRALGGGGSVAAGVGGTGMEDDGLETPLEIPEVAEEPTAAVEVPEVAGGLPTVIRRYEVPVVWLTPAEAAWVVPALSDAVEEGTSGSGGVVHAAASVRYYAEVVRLARYLMIQQRFIPGLMQTSTGELSAAWAAWLSDAGTAERTAMLVGAMPPGARCADDELAQNPATVTQACLDHVLDAMCRDALMREDFGAAVREKAGTDPHVAWLGGLLEGTREVRAPGPVRQDMPRRVRGWVSVLEERGPSSTWRLLLRLREPEMLGAALDASPRADDPAWSVTFHLQSVDAPGLVVDAADIWVIAGDSVTVQGRRLDQPQDLLLAELGRASRFYKRLEGALDSSEPVSQPLTTAHAYEFLREVRPILVEQGFAVEAPGWWDSPSARVGAKLFLDAEGENPFTAAGGMTNAARAQLGLGTLVNYRWEISVGDATLSLQEFEQLAAKRSPLVRINGRWVEVRPEDVHAAIKFIRENPGGRIKLAEAMRLAYMADAQATGVPIVGLQASGWLEAFLNSESASKQLSQLTPPRSFLGTLRPYQARGVSWMAFQEQLGFGICLADDMGLGKTIQLLALMAWERERPEGEEAGAETPGIPPTLLLVPMSVVGNWIHETKRFCPHLKVLVHHGGERLQGDAFLTRARESDLVITTYALAHRDRELLAGVSWGRVVLDEAQSIKNPSAKQSQAVHGFKADRRVALTGTPVENRLTELWSIMHFLNPGYLGGATGFRQRFAVPIERYRDKTKADQLRALIRPFVLRRLKTDPTVVADLPEKVESREFGHLTSEQAALYESCVKRMLTEVDHSEGMQRRGLVLTALVRLKQICDHPSLVLGDWAEGSMKPADASRSGKCIRVLEMLEEVLAEGDQALVFTQFRPMGSMLQALIRQRFDREALYIHGGVSQPQRQAIIDRFQRADGSAPVLILSLRAGGVGLNLTAATHVFHFDRWWNPAVENQATDRAYRIGQTRRVQVHKFVVRGTLEERIDQMIESKSELASNIIGQGEAWLGDLNTDQLREILTLRNDAIDDLD